MGREGFYWLKIPKAGSSFAATILGFACNSKVLSSTRSGIQLPDDCDRSRFNTLMHKDEQVDIFSWNLLRTGQLATERPLTDAVRAGKLVSMFRDARDRRVSEIMFFKETSTPIFIACCAFVPIQVRFHIPKMISESANDEDMVRKYFKLVKENYQGCMINLVVGRECFGGKPSDDLVQRAVYLVENTFAFVGLQDQWENSVDLFHLKFGGTLFDNEKRRNEPRRKNVTFGHIDFEDVDTVLYAAAKKRFEADMRHYKRISEKKQVMTGPPTVDTELVTPVDTELITPTVDTELVTPTVDTNPALVPASVITFSVVVVIVFGLMGLRKGYPGFKKVSEATLDSEKTICVN